MDPQAPAFQTRRLVRRFGDGAAAVLALDHVDLTVERGEFTAIIGPSGSGKSTLLNLVGGLDAPTTGTVELSGTDIAQMGGSRLAAFRRDHIGFVFQAYNLIPVLSAAENVEYIMLLQGVPAAERRQRVQAILQRVGLGELGHRRPGRLSGGQQQRVAVARAMVSRPDLILADEPTANLDTQTGIALIELMRELNREQGMTFVFSTHDEKIMERAQRLVRLRDGRIEADQDRTGQSKTD